jgi:hypothetical protein
MIDHLGEASERINERLVIWHATLAVARIVEGDHTRTPSQAWYEIPKQINADLLTFFKGAAAGASS